MSAYLRWMSGILATVALLASSILPSAAATRTPSTSTFTFPITRSGITHQLEYCATGSATLARPAVTRLVIAVHGDGRNACDYAGYIAKAAVAAGQAANTLVVAPRFLTSADTRSSSGRLYWSSSGWKVGDRSLTSPYPRAWTISSYEAVDALVSDIVTSGRLPNLSRIVVAGHSAGGQFVNRYAAGARWRAGGATTESFVVANPSSYLYWDEQRRIGGQWRPLTQSEVSACPRFDTYKYGLEGRNEYMTGRTESELMAAFASARVTYLLGALDTDPAASLLDTSCSAELQGSHRLERGQWYVERLPAVLGQGVAQVQSMAVVPGVGHSASGMFTSAAGLAALFG